MNLSNTIDVSAEIFYRRQRRLKKYVNALPMYNLLNRCETTQIMPKCKQFHVFFMA